MEYKQIKLNNGLRVIHVPMTTSQAATILILVGVGSRIEEKRHGGISHFLEHMFFKGTAHRPNPGQVNRELDRIGAQHNAFTSKEYTGYWVKVDASHFDTAQDIVSDILLESLFPEEEMKKEAGVILQEMNMYLDTPMRHIGDIFEELVYGDTGLGRFIIGTKDSLLSITRNDLLSYWKSHYGSNNMVAVVAGNVDQSQLVSLQERFVRVAPVKDAQLEKFEDISTGGRMRLEYKQTDQTHFMIGVRAYEKFSPKRYALNLLSLILGGNTSSRLWEEIREKRGLAYYLRSGVDLYTDTGTMAVAAGVPHDNFKEVVKRTVEELRSIKERGVTDEELRDAKENLRGTTVLELETSDAIAGFVAEQELFYNKIESPQEILAKYDTVTRDDIHAVAKEIFTSTALNLAAIGPHKEFDEDILRVL